MSSPVQFNIHKSMDNIISYLTVDIADLINIGSGMPWKAGKLLKCHCPQCKGQQLLSPTQVARHRYMYMGQPHHQEGNKCVT